MDKVLRSGDTVIWRDAWGSAEPTEARVRSINKCRWEGDKDGTPVTEALWDKVMDGRNFIVDLDNGKWAWGFQLAPKD